MSACHAEGRGFESRPDRPYGKTPYAFNGKGFSFLKEAPKNKVMQTRVSVKTIFACSLERAFKSPI